MPEPTLKELFQEFDTYLEDQIVSGRFSSMKEVMQHVLCTLRQNETTTPLKFEFECDDEGRPTEYTLANIECAEVQTREDCEALLEAIYSIWMQDGGRWMRYGDDYTISTANWNGNERIIKALENNKKFWSLCWRSSERGGHHKFLLPNA